MLSGLTAAKSASAGVPEDLLPAAAALRLRVVNCFATAVQEPKAPLYRRKPNRLYQLYEVILLVHCTCTYTVSTSFALNLPPTTEP